MGEITNRILIVEDDSMLRGALVDAMGMNGLSAIEARDGEEGLVKALSEHPDLILLDILLPKTDGKTVLKKLREDAWGNGVPVVIISNLDPDAEDLKEIEAYRASYYFIKSRTNIEQIVTKSQELLNTFKKYIT